MPERNNDEILADLRARLQEFEQAIVRAERAAAQLELRRMDAPASSLPDLDELILANQQKFAALKAGQANIARELNERSHVGD